jgi:hypothetical protein
MLKRLLPVFGVAAISAALLMAQERPGQPGTQPGQGDKTGDRAGQGGMAASIDGNWTVVNAARDGKAVDGADKMTVSIKGNVVTFAGGAGGVGDKNQMRALRLDFGPQGTIRVAEAGADGKFGDTGGTGKDRPGAGGTAVPPTGGTQPGAGAAQPGSAGGIGGADRHGTMSGVYVLTHDYLAISVFDVGTGTGTGGVRPGGAGGTGKDPQPGGAGGAGGTQPGGTGAGGTQPGGVGGTAGQPGATAGSPQLKTHVSVILKRSGGAGNPGGRP